MTETTTKQEPKASKGLAITYLIRFGIASPSGGRSEIENLNVIKKIREGFLDFPYASAQAMKRALRDTLKGLGYPVASIIRPKETGTAQEGPSMTVGYPLRYIDDDLFGYMRAASKKAATKEVEKFNGIRKSVVAMTPLLSLCPFQDNVDFGSNMMALQAAGNPMPYETEVHRGWYRVSIYVELDRIGTGDGFVKAIQEVKKDIPVEDILKIDDEYDYIVGKEKFTLKKKEYHLLGKNETEHSQKCYSRAKALLDAIRFLAPSGRSSNWLIDLTPKLMVAAYVKGARTPFLETPLIEHAKESEEKDKINMDNIITVKNTFADGIEEIVVGYRADLLQKPNMTDDIAVYEMRDAFNTINDWLKGHFNIDEAKPEKTVEV
jgi:CRISPR-associated protein Cst2